MIFLTGLDCFSQHEIVHDRIEMSLRPIGEGRDLGDRLELGQAAQPGDLDDDPFADQAELAGDGPERCDTRGVAPIDGRKSGQGGDFHG